jgi:hypothetical protein
MISMHVYRWTASTVFLISAATFAWAQQTSHETAEPALTSSFQKVEATVEAINPATREVTLKGPQGKEVTVTAGSGVKNLDKVHVGDKLVVSYYQGIAAQMSKGGATAKEPAASTFAYRSQTGTPGGGIGGSMTSTVTIEALDAANHTVAFRRPDGTIDVVTLKSPQMQSFAQTLKPGDKVDVTYTQSIAVNLMPEPSREANTPAGTEAR